MKESTHSVLSFILLLLFIFFERNVTAQSDKVHIEQNGQLIAEAEEFYKQSKTDVRQWYVISSAFKTNMKDPDGSHAQTASGGKYIEILPDTRVTHDDKLTPGINFSNEAGMMALIHYKVRIDTPGRYYVWVKAHSSGSEDNGVHVGLNGQWPASGQRLQWCDGKESWYWESKQRTEEVHCGVPGLIYLDIDKVGMHDIQFSLREDGFEMDQWLLTTDKNFNPRHADKKAASESLSIWEQTKSAYPDARILKATDFDFENTGLYTDKQWLAINPDQHRNATAQMKYTGPSGLYDLVFFAVGENDGQSSYQLKVNEHDQGNFTSPLSTYSFEEGARYAKAFADIQVNTNDIIEVRSEIGSADGEEYSRGRWSGIAIIPIGRGQNLLQQLTSDELNYTYVTMSGEMKKWHKITLTFDGPQTSETEEDNPFMNFRFNVNFTHTQSGKTYMVPGYFAADGNAGETSATSGNKWKVHFTPDEIGEWTYKVDFRKGSWVAISTKKDAGTSAGFMDAKTGEFVIVRSDKTGRDFRSKGRLQYVGERYLQFAETGEYFLKQGPDAPENFLSYEDFDGTFHNDGHKDNLVKTWEPHLKDWQAGDPTWKNGKGKAIIGAINYLASEGLNAFSFLTNNIAGDDRNVFPYIDYDTYDRIDVSKTDQWDIVFSHAQSKGLFLHFKTLEVENQGLLDNGGVGANSKLYYRELIARFGHHLALNWNLSEEDGEWMNNHPTPPHETEQRVAMTRYFEKNDPYRHHLVIHNGNSFTDLLGDASALTGPSVQTHRPDFSHVHKDVLKWINASKEAGKQWAVAVDEPGDAQHSLLPDAENPYHDNARKNALWGALMAGGWGCEWYFGYKHAHSDLTCQDYRSRDLFWDQTLFALNFFRDNEIPFWNMENRNDLVGNTENKNTAFCLAKENDMYVVYLNSVTTANLDLSNAVGKFNVRWFNPKTGDSLQKTKTKTVKGGSVVELGSSPDKKQADWAILVKRSR